MGSCDEHDWVRLAIVERFTGDVLEGRDTSLSRYLDLFPGLEVIVRDEWLRLTTADPNTTATENRLEPGPTLPDRIGPYLIERELGSGGQGAVYLALDERLGRKVALKVLHSRIGSLRASSLERFRNEAIVASRLQHPSICGVLDVGTHDGHPYVVMPWISGSTLAEWISKGGRYGADEHGALASSPGLCRFFEEVALGLHAMHEVGILHRDIKPGNLMVTSEGRPVILDLGLALDTEAQGHRLTHPGDILGTLSYLSPEQIDGSEGSLDARTDVFALGVSLYEAMTGLRPFDGPTRAETCQAIAQTDPVDPCDLVPSLSKDLRAIVLTAMDKAPDRRYRDMKAFADDLARVRDGLPASARPSGRVRKTLRLIRRHPLVSTIICSSFIVVLMSLFAALVLLREAERSRRQLSEARDRDLREIDGLRRLAGAIVRSSGPPLLESLSESQYRDRLADRVLETLDEFGGDPLATTLPGFLLERSVAFRRKAFQLASASDLRGQDVSSARSLLDKIRSEVLNALAQQPEDLMLIRERILIELHECHLRHIEARWDELGVGAKSILPMIERFSETGNAREATLLRALALECLADSTMRCSRPDEALPTLQECLRLRSEIRSSTDSGTAEDSELGLIHLKIAQALLNSNDLNGARFHLADSLRLAEQFKESSPTSAMAHLRLSHVWRHRAYLAKMERNVNEARLSWQLCVDSAERAIALGPGIEQLRSHWDSSSERLNRILREILDEKELARSSKQSAAFRSEFLVESPAELVSYAESLLSRPSGSWNDFVEAYRALRRAVAMTNRRDPIALMTLAKASMKLSLEREAGLIAEEASKVWGSDIPSEWQVFLSELRRVQPATGR